MTLPTQHAPAVIAAVTLSALLGGLPQFAEEDPFLFPIEPDIPVNGFPMDIEYILFSKF